MWLWLWFTDGHLLPYTGKEPVHYGHNTQRQLPVPAQTNLVTCDINRRVVDFAIQEGKGDLQGHVLTVGSKWSQEIGGRPVMVFNREGHGAAFFSALVTEGIPFVTWEKHTDAAKRAALEADRFADEFELNGKRYGVFEEAKAYRHALADAPAHCSQLRRITLWNKSSNRSACGLAWDGGKGMSTVECPSAILPPYVRLAPSPLPGGSYVEYPVIKHLAECFHSSR